MQLGQSARLYQQQRLGLKLSPQILLSVKLMELPLIELRERIASELEKNPALEVLQDKSVVSLSEFDQPASEEKAYFETSSDAGFIRSGGAAESDEHQQFIEGVLTRQETLQEHLLFQLRLQAVRPEIRLIGEILIQNLSNDGFHKEAPHLLIKDAAPHDLDEALTLVQSLDPQGCGTADYKESLAVQARLYFGAEAPDIEALVPALEALERGKNAKVGRLLKKSPEDIDELFAKLKMLSPFPGRQFAGGSENETRYVVPDVRVIHADNEFKILINNEAIPVLGITPFFLKNTGVKNPAERDFIRENIKEARWFITALNRRNQTLFRVVRALLSFQRQFFEKGPQHLVPLSLLEVANELNVHETTISRIANGKFIETEWGIFEVRRFFTNSISGAGSKGSRFSQEGVKEIIREIIQREERSLSDSEIVRILAERGITLARRTVAKYRAQLKLGSSYQR